MKKSYLRVLAALLCMLAVGIVYALAAPLDISGYVTLLPTNTLTIVNVRLDGTRIEETSWINDEYVEVIDGTTLRYNLLLMAPGHGRVITFNLKNTYNTAVDVTGWDVYAGLDIYGDLDYYDGHRAKEILKNNPTGYANVIIFTWPFGDYDGSTVFDTIPRKNDTNAQTPFMLIMRWDKDKGGPAQNGVFHAARTLSYEVAS